jgi:hypothetical protein
MRTEGGQEGSTKKERFWYAPSRVALMQWLMSFETPVWRIPLLRLPLPSSGLDEREKHPAPLARALFSYYFLLQIS